MSIDKRHKMEAVILRTLVLYIAQGTKFMSIWNKITRNAISFGSFCLTFNYQDKKSRLREKLRQSHMAKQTERLTGEGTHRRNCYNLLGLPFAT